ncbi:MAG: hypothetical protein M1821_003381 [Bathelium mastoideum]|nr:MAG: hypothetical protein M1821_003381 [Bathelium mastoideum]
MPQTLSSKEQSLFRQVIKFYESKQYKKGLKAAEQILRKNPNHGDTQAMKALILNSQGQSDEAFALGKLALKNDMKSHVCWHVYGLLWRSVKNFEESIKAYKFALKIEPDSIQIQRDLALLQVQMRDFQGYIQSRKTMLQQRPQIRQNWTALAVAHHLAGELQDAEKILSTYEDTLKQTPPKSDIEHSEALLYKNTIIAEAGEVQRALEHLEAITKNNLDRTAVMEMRADYLLRLDQKAEAAQAYRDLLERNNEYRAYYEGLETSLGLDRSNTESIQKLAELYDFYAQQGERIDAARRIPLDFLTGADFREAVDRYLRRMLTKGVPSTFPNIKALYKDSEKKQVIQDLVEGYASEKHMNGSAENQSNGDTPKTFEASVYYFLAQHYDYHMSRDLAKALEYIDKAIELDPSAVYYNMTKARVWKHYGNLQKAAATMNHARTLDERDRYMNTKCAKYQLRNDENDNAIATMSKFTRNETVGGALGDLHDMQCIWYLTEDGESFFRQQKFGLALKRFHALYDIFETWNEDQFDFHSFSLRKGQIRAYIDMVRWEDRLREHPFYTRAAISAILIYLLLHDKPTVAHLSSANGVPNLDGMDANERKKALKKAKREQEKKDAEAKEAEKKNAVKKAATTADGEAKKEDPDPNGIKLLKTEQPLEEAMKFLGPLLEMSPKNMEGQNVGFEILIRRKKYLLALKCLLAASSIDSANPTLHEQTVRFRQAISSLPEPLPEPISSIIEKNFTLLPKSTDLATFNENFLSQHKDSPRHLHAYLKVRQLLDPKSQADGEAQLHKTLEMEDIEIEDAIGGLSLLHQWNSSPEVKKAYLDAARKRWSEASVFPDSLTA